MASETSGGNGSVETRLREHALEAQDEADALARTVGAMAREVRGSVLQEMSTHPYRTLAVAAVTGFVLGGGLSLKVLRTATRMGARVAVAAVLDRYLKGS